MSKRYGLPYQGSKNSIAAQIVAQLPPAENFYDLFCGGCAIAHAAIESGKYNRVFINDKIEWQAQLFVDIIHGAARPYLTRWISREEFHALKDTDRIIALCWSFGNNADTYLYSEQIEPYKHALHEACLGNPTPFEEMGIHIPAHLHKSHIFEAKISIGRYIKAHHEEIKQAYIKWFKGYAEEQMQQYRELSIMRANHNGASLEELREKEEERLYQLLRGALEKSGRTQAEVCQHLNTQMAGHYFGRSQWAFPTKEAYLKMREILPALPADYEGETQILQQIKLSQTMLGLQSLQSLQRLQRLQSLESLESLEQSLRRVEIIPSSKSYNEVEILPHSVIYCDPPYKGRVGYRDPNTQRDIIFDHETFYKWCEAQTELCYISEYEMP